MSNLKNPPKPMTYTHPSYGMISFSRAMNGSAGRLFGSGLKQHYGTVRLRIQGGEWLHDLHADRYRAAGPLLLEAEMSAAQFAEAITTLNRGEGAPCTIRFFETWVDDPPDVETEVERVKSRFADDLKEMTQVMRERRAEIEKLTGKLGEKARKQLKIELDVMIQQLTSNIPFIMERFDEASNKVVTAAKTEIETFAQHALQAAGLDALAQANGPKQLAASLKSGKWVFRFNDTNEIVTLPHAPFGPFASRAEALNALYAECGTINPADVCYVLVEEPIEDGNGDT